MDSIRSRRLRLVPCSLAVAEAVLLDRGKAQLLLRLDFHREWPGPDTRDFFPYYVHLLRRDPELLPWGVWLMALDGPNGPVIGDLGFKGPPDERGVIDVGYSVVPEERAKGYATEAMRALIDWAFGSPMVKTLTADCEQANPASAAVLEKIGMELDGKKRHLLHWKMTRRDWERSHPGGEEAMSPRIHHI